MLALKGNGFSDVSTGWNMAREKRLRICHITLAHTLTIG